MRTDQSITSWCASWVIFLIAVHWNCTADWNRCTVSCSFWLLSPLYPTSVLGRRARHAWLEIEKVCLHKSIWRSQTGPTFYQQTKWSRLGCVCLRLRCVLCLCFVADPKGFVASYENFAILRRQLIGYKSHIRINFTPDELAPSPKCCSHQHPISMFHVVKLCFATVQYKSDTKEMWHKRQLIDTKKNKEATASHRAAGRWNWGNWVLLILMLHNWACLIDIL